MDNRKIGLFIHDLRIEQGLNQKELAERLCVTDKAVSKWETGRGIPDVSILQPLADIFGVTVGEILNGERMPEQDNNDEKIIKKLIIKRYIRLVTEVILTVLFVRWIYICIDTFIGMRNSVLDLCLHQKKMMFVSVTIIILMIILAVWLLTVILTAIFKKKASVFKTIIICFTIFYIIGASLYMAFLDDAEFVEAYDKPIDTVSYIKYEDFFDDNDFETSIHLNETNERITENYSACFDNFDENTYAYTRCVASDDYNIAKSDYEEVKAINYNSESFDMDKEMCGKFGVSEGYYTTNFCSATQTDVALWFMKGTSCYEVVVAKTDITDKKLAQKISAL